MHPSILLLLILYRVNCEESAQYLQNTVRDLRKLNYRQTLRRVDLTTPKTTINAVLPSNKADRRIQHNTEYHTPPPLGLTKGELLSLYENAVAKGDTLKINTGGNNFVRAAVHELDNYHSHAAHDEDDKTDDGKYYYYYYPIKSFADEMTSQVSDSHTVKIKKEIEPKKSDNKLEPLFMAISGLVGMAVMFVFSMIVLPKFGLKPAKKIAWPKGHDMDELAKLALSAIEGNDCRERFACELTKTARNYNIPDNRFLKLLKRITPGTLGQYMERFSYGNRQLKCTLIPCRKAVAQKVQKFVKKPPIRKKAAAHKKN
ncbi:unnamed protein product [Phyllotreta striolata]|uniref:Uncharacterized protein n=1 Tax=Phyllotreta striolata TaxID=444603 RepID=A0A9P0GRW3_PHYSR|nr:unnamed protein product [Phyllotreta striolata]